MRVFTDLEPICSDSTMRAAAHAVASRFEGMPEPRSVCEIGLDEEDYAWLITWGRYLHDTTAYKWLGMVPVGAPIGAWNAVTRREALGLLMLLLFAETARREALQGQVWPVIPGKFSTATRKRLFSQGHPVEELKESLATAARRFRLRHVFGVVGTQSYYISISLQFGFTEHGIDQLPLWLGGYGKPEAVAELLGGTRQSSSFGTMWRALEGFRHGSIAESAARAVLAASPWVLPAWIDEVLRAARRQPEFTTLPEQPASTESGFLSPPLLQWDGQGDPRFICRIADFAALQLDAPRYDLRVGEQHMATLIRQDDETYAGPSWIAFPPSAPTLIATLVAPYERPLAQCELRCWHSLDDVAIFELSSGRSIDAGAGAMDPAKDYALLTYGDITLVPDLQPWRMLQGGDYRLSLLRRDWPKSLEAQLEGATLWTPYLRQQRVAVAPAWVDALRLRVPLRAVLGEHVELRVAGLPPDAQLIFARLGLQMLPISQEGTRASLGAIALTPDLVGRDLQVTLGVRVGARVQRVVKPLDIDVIGAARLGDHGWQVASSRETLTVADAAKIPWRLFLPEKWRERSDELALMEDYSISGLVPRQGRPLGALSGYGGPVRISHGPYTVRETVLELAQSVIDPGIVEATNLLFDRLLTITLGQAIEPGPDHQVVYWQAGHATQIFSGDQITSAGPNLWRVQVPAGSSSEAVVVAVAFRGERLGTFWPDDLNPFLNSVSSRDAATATSQAALLRWMHLPLLDTRTFDAIRGVVGRAPVPVFLALMRGDGLPEDLAHRPVDEPWRAVVRRIFLGWELRTEQAQALLTVAGQDLDENRFPAASLVSSLNPMLLGRLACVWLRQHPIGEARRAAIRRLRSYHADLLGAVVRDDFGLQCAHKAKLEEVARSMGVDTNFILRSLEQPAIAMLGESQGNRKHIEDLLVALGNAPFREFLSASVLEHVLQHTNGVR